MSTPTAGEPPLMTTAVTGASPLVEATHLDLRPLIHHYEELPPDLLDAAAARLGKKNPARHTRLGRFFYNPNSDWLIMLLWLPCVLTFPVMFFAPKVGLPVTGLLLAGIVTLIVLRVRGVRGVAKLDELRAVAVELANPGTTVARVPHGDGTALQEIGQLPTGTRGFHTRDVLRLRGGSRAALDLELGVYVYKRRGEKRTISIEVPYLFVPLPPDLQARGGSWFRVVNRGLGERSDVGLSGPFDRVFAVQTTGDPAAALFVTQVLAPDVQELLLRGGPVDLVFSGYGVLVRLPASYAALAKDGRYDTHAGMVLVAGVHRLLHVVHEIYEQLDPARKLERSEKQAALAHLGLDPTR